ncbi:MAG: hypothetical protein JEZ05_06535 [Tenericutes bacterium]|nr:hypothetical protein [Mycoplasmatota bacterium]MBI9009673.1 hypothetical protein [Mycoplasmatota bacterium]
MKVALKVKGFKVNLILILICGLLMVVASILSYLLVVRGVYGNYRATQILPSKSNLSVGKPLYNKKVAILYSTYTENTLDDGSTWLNDNISTWETFLGSTKLQFEVVGDQFIEYEDLSEYGLILLPSTTALSDREITKIKKYMERGGSIFASGGTATMSDEGKWRGWEFFSEVFGLKFTKEIHPEEFDSKIHTLRGNIPITAGIPPGYTFKIATWDRPIYAEILDPRVKQISYWFDYRRESGLVNEEVKKSAGIVHGTYGRGRFVWFGFELNSVFGEQEDYIYLDKLFNNCINWLTYRPTAFVQNWPTPYKGAALFIPTVEKQAQNVKNLISNVLSGRKYPTTFFVDPLVAKQNPKLVKTMAQYGEIGSVMDVEFVEDIIDTNIYLSEKEFQLANIQAVNNQMISATGKNMIAVMPEFGVFNEYTLQGLAGNDIGFLVSDSLSDRSAPKIEVRNNLPIMIISNTVRDDNIIIGDYNLSDKEFQRYTYEEDVDRTLFEGGLYVLKIHSDKQMRREYVSVTKDILKYIEQNNIWLCSLKELKQWWMSRSDIEFRYESRSERRIAVEISNPLGDDQTDFVVQLNVNKRIKNIKISSDIVFTDLPKYEFNNITNVLYLYIDDLGEGESRSYFIDFDLI